jgi:fatty-acid desaturase
MKNTLTVPRGPPIKDLRAFILVWAIETALGFLMFAVMFGQVAAPIFMGVSTSGWDQYSILLWGFMMMIVIAAFLIRVIESAKNNFSSLI